MLLIMGFLYIPDASFYMAVGLEFCSFFFLCFFSFGRRGFLLYFLFSFAILHGCVSDGILHLLKEALRWLRGDGRQLRWPLGFLLG